MATFPGGCGTTNGFNPTFANTGVGVEDVTNPNPKSTADAVIEPVYNCKSVEPKPPTKPELSNICVVLPVALINHGNTLCV